MLGGEYFYENNASDKVSIYSKYYPYQKFIIDGQNKLANRRDDTWTKSFTNNANESNKSCFGQCTNKTTDATQYHYHRQQNDSPTTSKIVHEIDQQISTLGRNLFVASVPPAPFLSCLFVFERRFDRFA